MLPRLVEHLIGGIRVDERRTGKAREKRIPQLCLRTCDVNLRHPIHQHTAQNAGIGGQCRMDALRECTYIRMTLDGIPHMIYGKPHIGCIRIMKERGF